MSSKRRETDRFGAARRSMGFTLIELLVVIAIIAVLASMLLPVLGKSKQKAQGIYCMNNQHQVTLAWMMHAEDNEDRFAYAIGVGGSFDPNAWMNGWVDFNPGNSSNWDPTVDIQRSPLWPYCGNAVRIFRCPADFSTIVPTSGTSAGQRVPRIRSISMSLWMGGFGGVLDTSPPWRLYHKTTDFLDPGPSMTMVLRDEREDSPHGGSFFVDMAGYPNNPSQLTLADSLPASYHHRAAGVSYVDGHAEVHRWVDSRTMPPIQKGKSAVVTLGSPNNRDVMWLQERATRRIN